MFLKIIKSLYIIFSEVYSKLGFKGLKRLYSFTKFTLRVAFYIYLDHTNFENRSFLFYLCTKFDPLLLVSKNERDKKRAQWLLEQIILHGTTFIKLGQIMAARADLIPLVYMKELAKLQDEVPPFDNDLAFEIIKAELGRPITSIFAELDTMPLASASLGQVYKGILLDSNKEVIIKVQRPNLKEQIEEDVSILKIVAKEISKYPNITKGNDYCGLLDEFLRVINEEIDYIKEGKHCDLFRKNFRGYYRVYVPKVYWQFTTRHIITLEHIHGWKVTEAEKIKQAGFNLKEITREGCNVYLKQLLTDGFFHADPHPGNLRIMEDGRLAFFDFGMVGYVTKEIQINLVNTILHLINRDYKAVINDFITLGLLDKDFNRIDEIVHALQPVYDARFGHDGDITTSFKQIIEELAHIIYEYPFRIPVELALIIRALLTLEGVGHALDPGFNVIKALIPFVQRYIFSKEGEWFREHLISQITNNGLTFKNAGEILKVQLKL